MTLLRFLYWAALAYLVTAAAVLLLIIAACVASHVVEHWNDEAHPYSGFTPDYHTAHIDGNLPL